jgi:glycosyltransferase involved in cell wall biosynthesis
MNKENVLGANAPLVSVIMNCYNSEEYLALAIESVIAQTYTNWELIFWDNQSTDKSAAILKSFSDPRLKYFYAPEHTSLGFARNLAFNEAKGEWCGILDCDDLWHAEKLEYQMDDTRITEGVGVIFTDYNIISSDGTIKRASTKEGKLYDGDVFDEIFTEEFTVCWPTVLFRASALMEIGSFKGYKYLEDLDVLLRLAERYKFNFVNRKLASYRVHSEQASVNFQIMLSEKLDIFSKWESNWLEKGNLSVKRINLLSKAKAHAYYVAGINALFYGKSGVKFFAVSLMEKYSKLAGMGLLLSLLGPKIAFSVIKKVRSFLGHGEYY